MRRRTKRRAAALVETAVILPFLFMLLFGVWEVGRLVHVSQVVSNSAREGARLASTGLYTSSNLVAPNYQIQLAVANYLSNSGLPITAAGASITVTNETRSLAATANVTATSGATGLTTQIAVTGTGANPTKDPTNDSAIAQFEVVKVDVVYPFSFARWSPNNLFFFLGPNRNVGATARWMNLRDKPITVNSTIPNQPY